MPSKLRIIVTGLIAQYPLGGMAWHYLQYVVGLSRLGHDVYYFEDTGQYPYNPLEGGLAKTPSYNAKYLAHLFARYDLEDRWAYCFPWETQWLGLSDPKRLEVLQSADLLINVSGTHRFGDDYKSVRRRVFIDTDPVFTQVKLARGQRDFQNIVDLHEVVFSFGEHLSPNVPETGHQWLPTRQPILLDEWVTNSAPRGVFTTIMNWTSYKDVVHDGVSYGQKDTEFKRFIDLPALVSPTTLEVAVNTGKTRQTPTDLLRHKGWQVVDPDDACADYDSYRKYIQSSKAEFTVAKNGYVVGQAGWFSERSACYLAAGRPVVTQATGFSQVLPTGYGLFSFGNAEDAIAAIRDVEQNYEQNSRAAREIAEEYFDSDKVLDRLVERAMQNRASLV